MLSEIRCDAFKSYGKTRDTIIFHPGLNTVLGGAAANNSIGKSTFLLIIDYCFGGETYDKSDIKNHVGDHTICFAYEFDGKKYYFSRTVSQKKIVNVCDSNYQMLETMKLDDFKKFLYEHYCPEVEDATFREVTGRFFRIAGKKNDTINNPLNEGSPSMEPAVVALEKLFGLYRYVGALRKQLKESEDKKKAYAQARKLQLVPHAITRKKQYDDNAEKIKELEKKLSELTQVPKSFLEQYSDIERQIAGLRSQNEAFDNTKKFKDDVDVTKKDLTESERTVLDKLEAKINAQMVRFNDFIYEEEREAPVIKFENGKKYSFTTPRDGGTGTAYKSFVVLDMSILELTDLPAIAHDSSIFKNIGDEPIDKIMELYMKSKKQVFIAFDKEQAYSQRTGEILNETTVLRLNEGGDELFGYSWAKKKNAKK